MKRILFLMLMSCCAVTISAQSNEQRAALNEAAIALTPGPPRRWRRVCLLRC